MPESDSRVEHVAQAIQNAWAEWARTLPNPPATWCRTWDEISEPMRDVDRRLARAAICAYLETV